MGAAAAPPSGGMALAVRGRRRHCPVSERARAYRPIVWQGTGLEGPAARQSGIRTTHDADALHRRGCFGGAPVPRALGSTILVTPHSGPGEELAYASAHGTCCQGRRPGAVGV